MREDLSEEAGIELPANTGWPLLAALGLTLGFAGVVTHVAVTVTGIVLFAISATGWFRLVLPHQDEVRVPLEEPPSPVATVGEAERLEAGEDLHRMRLPLARHPYSAGIKGGLVGGIAMALTAELYGVFVLGSPWYVVNLLAASAVSSLAALTPAELMHFSAIGLGVGMLIHVLLSLFMGLLYGTLLPMFPRQPILWGGFVAPLLWTSLVYAGIWIVDPTLEDLIEWPVFVASQIAFGVVAGLVVDRTEKIETLQSLSIYQRAGVESPGVSAERERPE